MEGRASMLPTTLGHLDGREAVAPAGDAAVRAQSGRQHRGKRASGVLWISEAQWEGFQGSVGRRLGLGRKNTANDGSAEDDCLGGVGGGLSLNVWNDQTRNARHAGISRAAVRAQRTCLTQLGENGPQSHGRSRWPG